MNQCDGCAKGDAVVAWMHVNDKGLPYMVCQKKKYPSSCRGCKYDPAQSGLNIACIHPYEHKPWFYANHQDYSCHSARETDEPL